MIDDVSIKEKAKHMLKSSGIKYKLDASGSLTFVVPKDIEVKLAKSYNFNIDMLSIGGDIPLSELAVHVDEQASSEAYSGMLAEFTRYKLANLKDEFELWHNKEFYKIKTHMLNAGEKNVTDRLVETKLSYKYYTTIKKMKEEINTMEWQYRMLNNVVRASIITKGTMLPTLRNIVQGNELSFKNGNKLRQKLNMKGRRND